MTEFLGIHIGSKFDAKGFKKAESEVSKLTRNVKNLAATFGIAFGTKAIVNFAKSAMKASLEAQAQQTRLSNLLKVTVGANQAQVEVLNQQADALSKIGVVTNENITQTQSQLATFDLQISTIKTLTPAILDYVTAEKGAAASTNDFKMMTNGLAQALNGNFASLTKTGFVLDENTKNLIKNGTEAERAAALVKVLNSTYLGFNASLRATPQGQFQVLANEANQAKEIIGGGLLEAITILGENNTVDDIAADMKSLAGFTSDVIVGLAKLAKAIKNLPGAGGLKRQFIQLIDPTYLFRGSAALGRKSQQNQNIGTPFGQAGGIIKDEKASNKLAKDKVKFEKSITAEKKKQEALAKASKILSQANKLFDDEAMNLAAAAQGKLTLEEQVRVKLKQTALDLDNAINEGNLTAASRLSNALVNNARELDKLRGTSDYMVGLSNPFEAWLQSIMAMALELAKLANLPLLTSAQSLQRIKDIAAVTNPAQRELLGIGNGSSSMGSAGGFVGTPFGQAGSASTSVVVNISGSVSTERDLVTAITQGLYAQQASGTPVNYSTVY